MWLTNKQKSANYEAGTVYHKEIILSFTTFACTSISIYIANIITNKIIIIIIVIIFIIIILNNSLSGKIR